VASQRRLELAMPDLINDGIEASHQNGWEL
jgi:hypothetical protein